MSFIENKEIERINSDKAKFDIELEVNRNQLAYELMNGMGDRMVEDLKSPNKNIVIRKGFKYRVKKWWNDLMSNIKIIFYNLQ